MAIHSGYYLTLGVIVPNAFTFAERYRCAFKICFSTFASSTHPFLTASDKLALHALETSGIVIP